jgi:hypothetical protein
MYSLQIKGTSKVVGNNDKTVFHHAAGSIFFVGGGDLAQFEFGPPHSWGF